MELFKSETSSTAQTSQDTTEQLKSTCLSIINDTKPERLKIILTNPNNKYNQTFFPIRDEIYKENNMILYTEDGRALMKITSDELTDQAIEKFITGITLQYETALDNLIEKANANNSYEALSEVYQEAEKMTEYGVFSRLKSGAALKVHAGLDTGVLEDDLASHANYVGKSIQAKVKEKTLQKCKSLSEKGLLWSDLIKFET